jgi:hypothetical protein
VSDDAATSGPIRLTLQTADDEADPEELAELTALLQIELAGMQLDGLRTEIPYHTIPDADEGGTRAIEPFLGLLIVTIATPRLLAAVIKAIETWLAGRQHRSVEINTNQGSRIKIIGTPSRAQRRMVEDFLAQIPGSTAHSANTSRGTTPSSENPS